MFKLRLRHLPTLVNLAQRPNTPLHSFTKVEVIGSSCPNFKTFPVMTGVSTLFIHNVDNYNSVILLRQVEQVFPALKDIYVNTHMYDRGLALFDLSYKYNIQVTQNIYNSHTKLSGYFLGNILRPLKHREFYQTLANHAEDGVFTVTLLKRMRNKAPVHSSQNSSDIPLIASIPCHSVDDIDSLEPVKLILSSTNSHSSDSDCGTKEDVNESC